MPSPAAVTVVIAAYNAAGFIHAAIQSALMQTQPPHEILVVDDASTDGTVEAVERLATGIPSLRLLRMEANGGPSAARNKGIDHAAGDWIAVLDADDAFEPARLETLLTHCAEADILADDIHYFDHGAQQYYATCLDCPDGAPFPVVLADYVTHNQGSARDWGLLKPVFRRDFLNRHALRYPVSRRHAEDFDMIVECLLAGARFTCVPQPLYRYTMRHGEISRRESGLSRTRVDYAGIADMARRWAVDPRIAVDQDTARLFETRAASLDRLDERYRMIVSLAERRPGHLLRMLGARPGFAVTLCRHLLAYALSKLRRRDNA